jgi:sporulation protein YlmC with PRC-barrel domain
MRTMKLGSTLQATVLAALLVGSGVALAQEAPSGAPSPAPSAKPDYPPTGGGSAAPGAAGVVEAAPGAAAGAGAGESAAGGGDLKAAEIVGLPVVGSDGKSIGQVATVNSAPDGKVQDIEVKTGAILGFGGSSVKVPADKVVAKGDKIQLSMTTDEFKKLKTQTN